VIFRLIIVLKEEERIAADFIRTYELDPTQGLNMRPRKRHYVNNDIALKRLVQQFDLINVPTEDQIVVHLRAIQYRLAGNDFDNWNN
jgi:hypothetical protein